MIGIGHRLLPVAYDVRAHSECRSRIAAMPPLALRRLIIRNLALMVLEVTAQLRC